MNFLVTGSDGFVGSYLCDYLVSKKHFVRGALLQNTELLMPGVTKYIIGNIGEETDWGEALSSIDVVIHTAARVHVMSDKASNPLAEFRKTNVDGTKNLAIQAAKAGVKRLVFISSIKVNGESTCKNEPFRYSDLPSPQDPYGISKYEAEKELKQISENTGLEVVIVRPPLVYGPGVKANFHNMMKWVNRGVPLPLGSINNRRSLVSLFNLVDFLYCCSTNENAANKTFLVSDDEDISTTNLLKKIENTMGKKSRLIPISPNIISTTAGLLGKGDFAKRLLGSLQLDISYSKNELGWSPVSSIDETLEKTVKYFLENRA
ncbi:MAG: SDR family oxidoreductase [Gammaproteobacteria bacterium]|nr:MAG: SDR family oxidoreductase [Gammaproteobacteria bacterium]